MKAKLIVEGKEFNIEINDPGLIKLVKPPKKTGYEKVGKCEDFFYDRSDDIIGVAHGYNSDSEQSMYSVANYYSDRTVAENNARADKLMRQLRRFAVEHRESSIYWSKDYCNAKWSIIYDCPNNRVISRKHWDARELLVVYFDSKEMAELAIETFRDELTWYFTEYKDSL